MAMDVPVLGLMAASMDLLESDQSAFFLQRQGSVYKALSSGTRYLDGIIGSYETFIVGRNRY